MSDNEYPDDTGLMAQLRPFMYDGKSLAERTSAIYAMKTGDWQQHDVDTVHFAVKSHSSCLHPGGYSREWRRVHQVHAARQSARLVI